MHLGYIWGGIKLISASIRLAMKGKVPPQNAGSLPLTETIVSMWSLCAWTMNVNLAPWIAPQLTICQRGTKSDVPPIMKAILGNPAAVSLTHFS